MGKGKYNKDEPKIGGSGQNIVMATGITSPYKPKGEEGELGEVGELDEVGEGSDYEDDCRISKVGQ